MTYGTVNADTLVTSTSGGILGAGDASIMKNRIINGAMVIDQRNAGASVTPTAATGATYTVDRFLVYNSTAGSKFTVQQNAGSVTPPVGFTNYLGCTSSSAYSIGSGDFFAIQHRIEGFNIADLGWGTANAKTVTLSFQVYSSLTGTFGGSLSNNTAYFYPFTYTISSANTWTTISITITGATAGTWLTTNGIGAMVYFSLGTGSSLSGTAGSWTTNAYYSSTGATSVVGTSGATFYITGVQLEVGSSATGFEYVNYQTSLANCQRYCQVIGGSTSNQMVATAWSFNSTGTTISCLRPVQMRASPTLTYSALGDWQVFTGAAGTITPNAIGQNRPSSQSISMEFDVASGLTTGQAGAVLAQSINARLIESAEL